MSIAGDTPAVLSLRELSKRFGALSAVNKLSLDIHEGEILGLLGPNGAGKTTTIHMLCGLLKPDGGQVYLYGKPVDSANGEWRCRVGLCPQSNLLWEKLTCLEQLCFMAQMYGVRGDLARQRSLRLLAEMGLEEKSHQLARTLSGGMQRRLNLVMALVHDPEIIVLDEPEAGLDPQSRILVREYIRSLARRKTVLLTTHNMDEADRVADRVAIIDHGELLLVDTPQHLKQSLGAGDVIEMRMDCSVVDEVLLRRSLEQVANQVTLDQAKSMLHIRALDALRQLPLILEKLHQLGIHPLEMNVRANTLEDVFIQLTGRRLRE